MWWLARPRSYGARSSPTAEGGLSLPVNALIPMWNWNIWGAGRRERKVQSQTTHVCCHWISDFWGLKRKQGTSYKWSFISWYRDEGLESCLWLLLRDLFRNLVLQETIFERIQPYSLLLLNEQISIGQHVLMLTVAGTSAGLVLFSLYTALWTK